MLGLRFIVRKGLDAYLTECMMRFLFLFGGFVLFAFAPNNYSYEWCLSSFLVFMLNMAYTLYSDRKIELLGFNLIFSLSYLACSFLFPIFIYPINAEFSLFHHGYDSAVISKCTALSTFSYAIYSLGYLKIRKKSGANKLNLYIGKKETRIIAHITAILFLLFILMGGLQFFVRQYLYGEMEGGGIDRYIFVILSSFVVLICITQYYVKDVVSIIIAVAIMSIILLTGSRTLPLSMVLVLYYIYSSRKHLSVKTNIGFIVFGILSLYLIGRVRTTGINVGGVQSVEEMESDVGFLSVFTDLIIVNGDRKNPRFTKKGK